MGEKSNNQSHCNRMPKILPITIKCYLPNLTLKFDQENAEIILYFCEIWANIIICSKSYFVCNNLSFNPNLTCPILLTDLLLNYEVYCGIFTSQDLSNFSTSIFPRNPVIPVMKTTPSLNVSLIDINAEKKINLQIDRKYLRLFDLNRVLAYFSQKVQLFSVNKISENSFTTHDSERSDECIDSTMMCVFFCVSVYSITSRNNSSI
ncbi:hypothetical protein AGLY_005938 [Aphis glycines]|uniref:Uncharacterized protein n=1 Tax=Aphis glycines TaxID=307491 RepID=A0A6G0TUM6_APHGL|nr:hypothetical protein AGLY_005938 [Aphis glycines]